MAGGKNRASNSTKTKVSTGEERKILPGWASTGHAHIDRLPWDSLIYLVTQTIVFFPLNLCVWLKNQIIGPERVQSSIMGNAEKDHSRR